MSLHPSLEAMIEEMEARAALFQDFATHCRTELDGYAYVAISPVDAPFNRVMEKLPKVDADDLDLLLPWATSEITRIANE